MQRVPLVASEQQRVEAGLPFVESLARRMASTMPHSIDLGDLVQDGVLGPNLVQKIVRTEVSVDPGFKVLKAILRNLTVVAEAKRKVGSSSSGGDTGEAPSPTSGTSPILSLSM